MSREEIRLRFLEVVARGVVKADLQYDAHLERLRRIPDPLGDDVDTRRRHPTAGVNLHRLESRRRGAIDTT